MSSPHKPSSDGRFPESDDKAERALFDALCEAGWIAPQTLEDVRRAEAELAGHAVPLPPELRDTDAVFHGANRSRTEAEVTNKAARIEAERNLARAAREGGQIPPEVEERMRHDREAAEREST